MGRGLHPRDHGARGTAPRGGVRPAARRSRLHDQHQPRRPDRRRRHPGPAAQRARPRSRPRGPHAAGRAQALLLEERQVAPRLRVPRGQSTRLLGAERLSHARRSLERPALRRSGDARHAADARGGRARSTVGVRGGTVAPDHHADASRSRRALLGALALSGAVFVVEVVGALWTGSLALAADAGHMFADVGGLGLALFASWIAARPPTPAKTYGYQRAEILAALANSVVMMALAAIILYEAYHRLHEPRPVPGGPLLALGLLGLGANALSMWVLQRDAGASLNVKAAYLEVLGDALGSVGVLVAAVVIMTVAWTPIDSLVSVAIGVFIVVRTWRLLIQ